MNAEATLVLAVMLLALVYLAPTLVAAWRDHHNTTAIFVLNLLLGWTALGWIAALVWACTSPQQSAKA